VVGLVIYLLQQEYEPSQITVLTPYLGQLRLLKDRLREKQIESLLDARDIDQIQDSGEEEWVSAQNYDEENSSVRVATVDK
jgi:superfamily I DNA and/or RNA helicase